MYEASIIVDIKKQLDIWQKKGFIKKLHNIVMFICPTL